MPAHKKVSTRQMELLVEYMEEHRDLAVGRLTNNGPQQKIQTKLYWEEVAAILNAIGDGTVKKGPKWREFWNEKKYALRRKASDLSQHAMGTGGGPAKKGSLTALEERMLSLLGKVAVHGNTSVRIPFDSNIPLLPPIATASPQSSQPMPSLVQRANAEIELMPSAAPETVTVAVPDPVVVATPATVVVAAPAPVTVADPAPVNVSAPAAVVNCEHNSPLTNRQPRAADRHIVPPVPQWALDMENRRRAAEERTADALEAIARSIRHIEELLVATLSNVVVQEQQ